MVKNHFAGDGTRIALDLRYRTGSGASSYIHNLVPRLVAKNTSYRFVAIMFAHQDVPGTEGMEVIICPDWGPAAQILWDQFVLPFLLKARKIRIYHTLKMLGSMYAPCPQVKVAHSITSPYKGEFPASFMQNLYWIVLGNRLYRHSDRLIAVSRYVGDFLMDVLHIPKSRISVICNGVDPKFNCEGEYRAAPAWLGVDRPFLLTVGNIFPVKNHRTALLAFAKLAEEFPDYQLVMAGGTGHKYCQALQQTVVELGLEERVHFPGFISSEQLVEVYRSATLLVMPSLTEGCPVTLLEAIACGVPVVGSRRGGIEEVGGDAVRLVDDPDDVPAWAAQIRALIVAPEERTRLSRLAQKRALEFDWDVAARSTLAVYGGLST